MKPFLFGISPYHPDAPWQSASERFAGCGGNTGNFLFVQSIMEMVGASFESIDWHEPFTRVEECSDGILVMPLANQLGPHANLGGLAERLKSTKVPLVGMGLGAQGSLNGVDLSLIPDGTISWLERVVEMAPTKYPNLTVRGETTLNVLRELGLEDHAIVAGCPSNFLNPERNLGKRIHDVKIPVRPKVGVAAGNPARKELRNLEQSLWALSKDRGIYVVQDPFEFFKLALGQADDELQDYVDEANLYIAPGETRENFLQNLKNRGVVFTSASGWIEAMKSCDVVVGTRIHGVMAAIQAGTPGVCLLIDSRTRELCQTMNIPHLNAYDFLDGITLDDIYSCLELWDYKGYDELRLELGSKTKGFLENNGLSIHGNLSRLLEVS